MALFEKFRPDYAKQSSVQREIKNILDNLNNILNTRKNYGSFIKDLGIRDLNQYTTRDQIAAAVMEEIRYNIEHFEPRLELNNITLMEGRDVFCLSFKIECTLKDTKQTLQIEFDSIYKDFSILQEKSE